MKDLIYKLFFKKTEDTKLQFFRYLFVGGFAAIVNIGSLYVLTDILKVYYLLSNVVGFILGLTINYLLSKLLVFTTKQGMNKALEFLIYAVIGILGLGLDTLFMWIGTSIVGIYYLITKIISTGLVFVWNFGARKILYNVIDKRKEV